MTEEKLNNLLRISSGLLAVLGISYLIFIPPFSFVAFYCSYQIITCINLQDK